MLFLSFVGSKLKKKHFLKILLLSVWIVKTPKLDMETVSLKKKEKSFWIFIWFLKKWIDRPKFRVN